MVLVGGRVRGIGFAGIAACTLVGLSCFISSLACAAEPITPTKVVNLLEDKELSKWYPWLQDAGRTDPRGVFTMQDDGVLRISGDGFGGLTTNDEYQNYYLVMEYRWGTETWGTRKEKSRDSGLLLHCQGPDGNFGGSADKPGPWMTSLEFQVIEGGVGDILVLRGKDENGQEMEAAATCTITRDRDGEAVWNPDGESVRFTKGRINWFGRDPDWADVLGVRGPKDVDSPKQEWTKIEAYCSGDSLVYLVNGTVVNRATEVIPSQGKILVQTEGAELFVRRLELHPLPAKLP